MGKYQHYTGPNADPTKAVPFKSKTVSQKLHAKGKYQTKFEELLKRVAKREKAFDYAVLEMLAKVHDPKGGDTGKEQLDEFDPKPIAKAMELVTEVFVHQELAKIVGLDTFTREKLLANLIDRKLPRPVGIMQSPPSSGAGGRTVTG